jgi:hypothetical protein
MGSDGNLVADNPDRLTAAPVLASGGQGAWNRFVGWPAREARVVLFAFLMLLVASAMVPVEAGRSKVETQSFTENLADTSAAKRERDDDLALYDRAIERIRGGEHYYDFIVAEQRAADYPLRPGVAVRLPTLAYINAWLGMSGQVAASLALLLAVMMAWWRRLGEEPGGKQKRLTAFALLLVGASLGLNRHFFVLHELWAGMLLALSFALHRPGTEAGKDGKWGWALAVAALAVAIREHALPFILLMAALALWRRNWKEGAAWSVLALAFLALLAVHLQIIGAQVLPSDPYGQGWMELRGLSGWISYVALSSNLRFLPGFVAGPLVVLAMLGWAAWKSPAGLFGLLLYAGYGLLFMIAGRPDNFYWGAMVAPAMLVGLAFAAPGLRALIAAAAAPVEADRTPQSNCA